MLQTRKLVFSFSFLYKVKSRFLYLRVQNYNQIEHLPTNNLKEFIYLAAHSPPRYEFACPI